MFNLIISILSISLVSILALASIYYGGYTFNKDGDSFKCIFKPICRKGGVLEYLLFKNKDFLSIHDI